MHEWERGSSEDSTDINKLKVRFGQTFSPFKNGFKTKIGNGLPKPTQAFGFSSSFSLEGLGESRIELFEEGDLNVSHPIPSVDPLLRNYDRLIANRVESVIYLDEVEGLEIDLECIIKIRDAEYKSRYSSLGEFSEIALFDEWEKPSGSKLEPLWIHSPVELRLMSVRFNRLER